MSEISIVLSPTEVRAALDGRLRQIWRPVVVHENPHLYHRFVAFDGSVALFQSSVIGSKRVRCPLGQPGDVLWGRETWATLSEHATRDHNTNVLRYRADYVTGAAAPTASGGWRPSTQMPRWASRIQLRRVGEARVVRVQEIMSGGIVAAGFRAEDGRSTIASLHDQFAADWDRRYAKRGLGWGANPWAWAAGVEGVSE